MKPGIVYKRKDGNIVLVVTRVDSGFVHYRISSLTGRKITSKSVTSINAFARSVQSGAYEILRDKKSKEAK